MSRLRHEAGQTVVLFAVLLPLFLGLGAIAVDIGYWYVVKKTAQDAADAAALAAAAELPSKSLAEEAAAKYVRANMPGASWQVEYPYVPTVPGSDADLGVPNPSPPLEGSPDPTKIQVIVEQHADTLFGRMFGWFDTVIASRAVAQQTPGSRRLAIFSHGDDCDDGLYIDAIGTWIDGLVHSNGQYDVHSGSGPDALWAADGTIWKRNCVSSLDPDFVGAVYGPGPDFLPRDVWEMMDWPLWRTPAELGWPACSGSDFSGRVIEFLSDRVRITDPDLVVAYPDDLVIPPGTYCALESIAVVGAHLRGSVSLLAPQISVEGSGLELSAHANDVLFFAIPNASPSGNPECMTPTPQIVVNGGDDDLAGLLFNPCGRVVVNSSDSEIEGAVLGEQVLITGDRLRLTGTPPVRLPVALVE